MPTIQFSESVAPLPALTLNTSLAHVPSARHGQLIYANKPTKCTD